jgi:hypothetical protein
MGGSTIYAAEAQAPSEASRSQGIWLTLIFDAASGMMRN